MAKIVPSTLKPLQGLAAIAFGFFTARVLYELDPLGLSIFGDWPATLVLTISMVIVAYFTSRIAHRPLPPAACLLLIVYVLWPDPNLRLALILFLGTIFLAAQQRMRPGRARLFDLIFAAIVFAVYLATLGDHVGRADTFEFQVVAPQLGIAHPTGYPFYILIGKLFSLLPIGSMAFRVNLTSAVFATLAVIVIYGLIDSLSSDRLVAAIAAMSFAASAVFWSQAIVAEVYALNALFAAIIASLLVRVMTSQSPNLQSSHAQSTIYVLAFTSGLALTHHLTAVILIPAILLALLLAQPKLSLKSWLIAWACLLLGLTPWLYIPLRWPALHNGMAMSFGEWSAWIFGQRFGGALNLSLWNDPTRWNIVTRIAFEQFGPIGLALTAAGLLVLFVKAWRIALIMLVIFTGYFFYGLVYNVPDVDVFIIPAFMMMAIWIGAAISFVVKGAAPLRFATEALCGGRGQGTHITRHLSLVTHYLLLPALLLPVTLIANNFPLVNQRGVDADLEQWGRYVLSLPIPEHAAILVDSEKIAPLYYLQITEQIRPDLDIVVLGDEALYRRELDRRMAAGQAVYLARFLPNLPYRMRSLGPLVEVSQQPMTHPPPISRSIHVSFGDDVALLGVADEQGDPYRITFFWQATSLQRKNYHIRLQLIDSTGTVWWEDRGAHPVSGYYPTGAWARDEIVADYHEIKVEPFVPAGEYDLVVGLFTPFRDDGLAVNNGNWLKVARVRVAPRVPEPLAREVRMIYGLSLALMSVENAGSAPPLSDGSLRVNANGNRQPAQARLVLIDGDGRLVSTTDELIQVGQSRLTFRTPEEPGIYYLRLNLGRSVRCGWLALLDSDCVIGKLQVEGEALDNAINFDNQVLLLNEKIDRDTLKPNESLHIDLTWRGLKKWDADYTVFVHLVGPDGKVHGQVDQWPVQGTLPTTSWDAGQIVNDPYLVTLPPDAPGGQYQVEVGWYLLATLRRLPVLDAGGQLSDDKVIVGEFVVP